MRTLQQLIISCSTRWKRNTTASPKNFSPLPLPFFAFSKEQQAERGKWLKHLGCRQMGVKLRMASAWRSVQNVAQQFQPVSTDKISKPTQLQKKRKETKRKEKNTLDLLHSSSPWRSDKAAPGMEIFVSWGQVELWCCMLYVCVLVFFPPMFDQFCLIYVCCLDYAFIMPLQYTSVCACMGVNVVFFMSAHWSHLPPRAVRSARRLGFSRKRGFKSN